MCGNKNTSTNTSTAPNPQAMSAYQSLIGQAGNVAQTPFTPYGGEFVAPVNAQQQSGIGNINANASYAQPYIGQAAGDANAAAAPITAAQIAQYQNPYTQQVVNATQGQFNQQNAQQQASLIGNAGAQGALGGDRVGVAQANLAGQQQTAQAPVIANLESQGYTTGLSTALAEQQNMGNMGFALGNLGVAGQNAALTGANAQIGAGTLQQQTQQAQDAAKLQQFYQQQAYPFQTTQWLAGIDTGVGSQMGGTSQTTPPPPNMWNQALGLGLAGAAAFARDGGRINRDIGGGVPNTIGGMPYASIKGYVPTMNITGGSGAPKAPGVPAATATNWNQYAQAGKGLGNMLEGPGTGGALDLTNGFSSGEALGSLQDIGSAPAVGGIGALYAKGGRASLGEPIRLRPRGYDVGGTIGAGFGAGSLMPPAAVVDDRFAPVYGALRNGEFDPQGANAVGLFDPGSGDVAAPAAAPGSLKGTKTVADMGGVPDIITRGPQDSATAAPNNLGDTPTALGYMPADNIGTAGAPDTEPESAANGSSRNGIGGLSLFGANMSPAARQGLLTAGLAMMASRSPYLGQAIGEGGLHGVAAYSGEQKQEMAAKKTQADIDRGKQQLAQSAKAESDRIKMETARMAQAKELHMTPTPAQTADLDIKRQQLAEAKRQHDMTLKTPVKIADDPRTGAPIMALPRLNPNGAMDYYLIKPDGSISTEPLGAAPQQPAAAPGPSSALPSSPANASTRVAALTSGTSLNDGPRAGEGLIPYNQRVTQGGAYDYTANAPYIEKGLDVPEPQAIAGRSVAALKTDSEYYLQTGKLPPVRAGNSPVARVQQNYRNAVQNYGMVLAQSRGITPEQTAEAWRSAPGMLRFILGADGRSTVSLGTAVRHLDTLQQYAHAWQAGDQATINRIGAALSREFGGTAATNLQSAAQIVGPEIIKAIGIAGGGTEGDRADATNQFGTARSLDQVLGAIGVTQRLLSGQLEGKERQAVNAGLTHERFRSLIGDRPYEILSALEKRSAAPAQQGAAPGITAGTRVGEERQFRQGVGVWNGTAWVPKGTQ